jgi:hypothetical protein
MGFGEPPAKRRGLMAFLRNPATVAGILVAWACLVAGGAVASDLAGDAAFVLAIAPPLVAGLLLQQKFPSFARGLFLGFPTALAISPLVLAALGLYTYFAR